MSHVRMVTMDELRKRGKSAVGPFLGAALLVYFSYHAVQGDRGLVAWWHMNKEAIKAEEILADLKRQETALERRVALLRPERLDPDMLEERARFAMNLGDSGDIVILRPSP